VETFVLGIISGLVAAAIWSSCVWLLRYRREATGPVAGWWWQVIYLSDHATAYAPPTAESAFGEDLRMSLPSIETGDRFSSSGAAATKERLSWGAFSAGERPWSVELVQVRNKKRFLSGRMWRVYKSDYYKRWRFQGRIEEDSILHGFYWAEKGAGSSGTFYLLRVSPERYVGEFYYSEANTLSRGLTLGSFAGHLQWIKVDSSLEKNIVEWLVTTDSTDWSVLPERVKRQLHSAHVRSQGRSSDNLVER
jgi:hypothetical protein